MELTPEFHPFPVLAVLQGVVPAAELQEEAPAVAGRVVACKVVVVGPSAQGIGKKETMASPKLLVPVGRVVDKRVVGALVQHESVEVVAGCVVDEGMVIALI